MSEDRYELCRRAMVREQLRSRDIHDPVTLEAISKVPRERFVRPGDRDRAYGDYGMAIGFDQTISQPYMVALMSQCLELSGKEKVLEVGTGSGYQSAVLAEIGCQVYTIERLAALSERAEKVLRELGYDNIRFAVGDGTLGWPEEAPFDRIIVTAAAPSIPNSLVEQLAQPGILVIPAGPSNYQVLYQIRKDEDGHLHKRHVLSCVFVKLIGREGWQAPAGGPTEHP